MSFSNQIFFILSISLFTILFFYLGNAYRILSKDITIKNKDGSINKDKLDEKLRQVKLLKTFEPFLNNDIEYLLRVSKNPWNLSPFSFVLLRYCGLILGILIALLGYGITEDGLAIFIGGIVAAVTFIYPKNKYKTIIKERENSWNKIYSYIWRMQNDLETNDPKKMCIDMRDYLAGIGESEMASGFNYFYECWPERFDDCNKALNKFEEIYPFQLPRDLYFVVLETWRNASEAGPRLENFRKSAILKYEKYSNQLLANVPATATTLSLPFLLFSVMIAILVPAVLAIIDAMG